MRVINHIGHIDPLDIKYPDNIRGYSLKGIIIYKSSIEKLNKQQIDEFINVYVRPIISYHNGYIIIECY